MFGKCEVSRNGFLWLDFEGIEPILIYKNEIKTKSEEEKLRKLFEKAEKETTNAE